MPRSRSLALALALLLAGCGSESEGRSHGAGPRWRSDGELSSRPFDLSHREFAALTLPGAKHAVADSWESGRRYIVNLSRRSSIVFKRMEWRVDSAGLESLRRGLVALSGRGRDPPVILVRADRAVPWRAVRQVLEVLGHPDLRIASWQFGTVHPDPRLAFMDAHFSARASVESGTAGTESVSADLVLATADGAVQARRGATSWDFPAGDVFEDAARLAVANRHWDDLEASLASAPPAAGLRIEVGDDVPWAYALAAFDCAHGAGVRDVRVVGTPIAFRLLDDVPVHVALPGDVDPRDWHPALAVAIGVLAAFALFALGAWAGRNRPRRIRGARGGA